MSINKYRYLISYLNKLNEFKFDYSLLRIEKVLKILKNPQNYFNVIHITGSNGKGSVAMYLSYIFRENKIKVGTYLSPHIKDVRERILINCKKVKNKIFLKEGLKLIEVLNKSKIKLTYFEFLTVLAFLIFKNLKIKIAAVEVGLGGRYDATNVEYKNKILSIITSISKEHTDYLGKTEISILKEKAEIIRNSNAVCNFKKKNLKSYVKNKYGNKVFFNDDFYKIKNIYYKNKRLNVETIDRRAGNKEIYKSKMVEISQAENILTVLTALKLLNKKFKISDERVKKAIEKMFLKGRLTLHKKGYLLSVAHNPDAIENMFKSLLKIYPGKRFLIIFSLLKDKNIKKISKIMGKLRGKIIIIITEIKNERAMDVNKIKKYMIKYNIKNYIIKDNKKAIKFAYNLKKKNDIILITGSFYIIKNFV